MAGTTPHPMSGEGDWDEVVQRRSADDKKKKSGGFQSMNLEKDLLKGILHMNFNVPTPIQRKAVPPMIMGSDVVAMARTGSGKTAAYLIPLLQLLKGHSKVVGIRGLVFSPTRELALQIFRVGIKMGRYLGLKWATVVGGNALDQQFEDLAGNPDIVVSTPGRLLHIVEETGLQLSLVKMVILDEADRLFELGLQPQIIALMQKIPDNAQRALFSATMPTVLAEFTNAGLHNPVVIRLDAEMKISDKLKQSAFLVRSEEKLAALIFLLRKVVHVGEEKHGVAQSLVFVESRHHVEMIEMLMNGYLIPCSAIHGNMDQEARRNSIHAFTKKQTHVMIVTDVAARGLDIPLLDYVINFSFPFTPKLFVHRVGRVARAGRSGTALSIMTFDDMPYYMDLMDFLGRPVSNVKQSTDLLAFDSHDGFYGRLPEDALQVELDYIRRLSVEDVEFAAMLRVSDNAHKKYTRTKKKATHEAIQEAKLSDYRYDQVALHPMFVETLGSDILRADSAKTELKRFKAKDSVLEIIHGEKMFTIKKPLTIQDMSKAAKADAAAQASVRKPGETMAASAAECTAQVATKPLSLAESLMLRAAAKKRDREATAAAAAGGDGGGNEDDAAPRMYFQQDGSTHNATGSSAGQHRLGGGSHISKYQDRDFYLPDERRESHDDVHYSVKDATFDLGAETATEAQQQRMVFAWNKKKNRYTKMHVNDAKAMLRGMKNEAGKSINFKEKLDAYKKWTTKSNMRIQDVGEEEDLGALARARGSASGRGNKDVTIEDDDYVDISDPNQGKKLRMGRKQRKLPKDGHVKSFEELATERRKATREKEKLARRSAAKHSKKRK